MTPYEARLQRRVAAAKERETYYTRRRHMLARVKKAVPKARASHRVKPETKDETIVLDLWVSMDAPDGSPLRVVSVPLRLTIPFDLTTPEIVRLIRVRATLEHARKGTRRNV